MWDEEAETWFVDGIEHFDLTCEDVEGLNASLRDSALVECFGSDPDLVEIDPATEPRDPASDPFLEPHLLVPSPKWLRARETDWAKLLTIASTPPETEADEGPWTVYAEVMPKEEKARQELQEDVVGPGAKWSIAAERKRSILRRLREKVRRRPVR